MSGPSVSDVHVPSSMGNFSRRRKQVKLSVHDNDSVASTTLSLDEIIALVFSGGSDPKLPDRIKKLPTLFRRMFVDVFNRVFARSKGMSKGDREANAFKQAQGVVKRRMVASELLLQGVVSTPTVSVKTGKSEDGHDHVAVIDRKSGNGETSRVNDHVHAVVKFKVRDTNSHTHTLPTALRLTDFLVLSPSWGDWFDPNSTNRLFVFSSSEESMDEIADVWMEEYHSIQANAPADYASSAIPTFNDFLEAASGELVESLLINLGEITEEEVTPHTESNVDSTDLPKTIPLSELAGVYAEENGATLLAASTFSFDETVTGADDQTIARDVQLLRIGKFSHPRFGDFNITRNVLQRMADNFSSGQRRVVLDYGHASAREGVVDPHISRAAGWIQTVFVKDNGLFADVKLTKEAVDFIRNEQYQFISPEFTLSAKSREAPVKSLGPVLMAVALTNRPFVEGMAALKLSELSDYGGLKMPDYREILGLSEEEYAELAEDEVAEKLKQKFKKLNEDLVAATTTQTEEDTSSDDDTGGTDKGADDAVSEKTTAEPVTATEVEKTVFVLREDNKQSAIRMAEMGEEITELKKERWDNRVEAIIAPLERDGRLGAGEKLVEMRGLAAQFAEKDPSLNLLLSWSKTLSPIIEVRERGSSDRGPRVLTDDEGILDGNSADETIAQMALKKLTEGGKDMREVTDDDWHRAQDEVIAEHPKLSALFAQEYLGEVSN